MVQEYSDEGKMRLGEETSGHSSGISDMKKTNAARYLDRLKMDYRIVEYEVDESDLRAESVAKKVGLPPAQVFKTLVARGDKTGVFMACIPEIRNSI